MTVCFEVNVPCIGRGCSYITASGIPICGAANSSYSVPTKEYPTGLWWKVRYRPVPTFHFGD